MEDAITTIVVAIAAGVIARIFMLKSDFRQYPSYPHGYITHISLGFMAAALGAVAIPAIALEDFVAVTFLTLAAQQFRDIRNMERETLSELDSHDLVPRGPDYIEGIAKVFETRNYLVMGTSLLTAAATYLVGIPQGIVVAILSILALKYMMKGKQVGEICEIKEVDFKFKGAMLDIDGVIVKNVGMPDAREKLEKEALAVVLKPKDDNARATLDDLGQRQAILHTAVSLIGSKIEDGEPEWAPLARKNIDTGELFIFIHPNEKDVECLIEAIKITPVLESSQRNILQNKIGKKASD